MSVNASTIINLRRLKEVGRCNNFFTLKKEDDAQHSYYVAIISELIAEDYNSNVNEDELKFNIGVLLKKALFHDIEESFIGDIPHNIKHSDKQTGELIDKAVNKKIDEVIEDDLIKERNKTAKQGFEGQLIDLVDMLELAFYSLEEIVKGNNSMIPLYKKAVRIVKEKDLFKDLMVYSFLFRDIMIMLESPVKQAKKEFVKSLNID